MHALPDREIDLDSSGARFEAVDLNERRVDEEATWFCSDAMTDVAGQLGFLIDCRNAFGKRSHTSSTSDATNRSPDIALGLISTMMSQDSAMAESDGSAKKRVVRPPNPLPGTG